VKFFISSLLLFNAVLYGAYLEVQTNLDEMEMLDLGKKVYEQTCVSCHAKRGETDPNIKLVVRPRQLQKTLLTEEQSFKIIRHGAHYFGAHTDLMPAFKYVYNDEEIAAVVLYITRKFNPKRVEKVQTLLNESQKLTEKEKLKMLGVGKKIFQKKCAKCHGITGNGESDYVKQSKVDKNFIYPYNLTRTLLSEDQIFLYAKFGGHFWGTDKKDMPSWKHKYNDVKLKSVAKYVEEEIKKLKE
jgi:mono/diheme cytochrome c family protein